mmetsp:Transcript_7178/g.20020  ORF Transcript_7178/g.20020 Transcript_7178/m.20020 type:complete len:239 (+) Transcript_7178:560-1276(+)
MEGISRKRALCIKSGVVREFCHATYRSIPSASHPIVSVSEVTPSHSGCLRNVFIIVRKAPSGRSSSLSICPMYCPLHKHRHRVITSPWPALTSSTGTMTRSRVFACVAAATSSARNDRSIISASESGTTSDTRQGKSASLDGLESAGLVDFFLLGHVLARRSKIALASSVDKTLPVRESGSNTSTEPRSPKRDAKSTRKDREPSVEQSSPQRISVISPSSSPCFKQSRTANGTQGIAL